MSHDLESEFRRELQQLVTSLDTFVTALAADAAVRELLALYRSEERQFEELQSLTDDFRRGVAAGASFVTLLDIAYELKKRLGRIEYCVSKADIPIPAGEALRKSKDLLYIFQEVRYSSLRDEA